MSDGIAQHPFPIGLNADTAALSLVNAARADLSSAPFLDERFDVSGRAVETLSFEAAQTAACSGGPAPPPGLIFHTAFCCSTLLARALDRPGRTLSLKEPGVLMSLANVRRTSARWGHDDTRFRKLALTVFALLGRRFEPAEQVLVKPTNAANNLLPAALASGARVLLLYSDLPGFLVSVIKKGEACRYFVRHLLNIFRLDRPDIDGWPHRQAMLLTDLQVAALVWHIQIECFEQSLSEAAAEQVRTLRADDFLGDVRLAVQKAQTFLGLGYSETEIDSIVASPLFQRHSKFSDRSYDNAMREAEKARVMERCGEEIATTLEWARRLRGSPVPERLARPLF